MAITKQYLKSKPICKVTFLVPAGQAEEVKVLGTFNDWNKEEAAGLKKLKNGNFKGTLNLAKDQAHEFRYLIDGEFANEEQADAYVRNDFGTENGVLNL